MKIRVYYEDTDLGGVVYHSKYLNFCERARSELFFAQGKQPVYEGYHFVVRHIDATFFKPAKFGDLLEVVTNVSKLKSASVILEQKIFKEETTLFSMQIELVCLKDQRPAKIPPYFLDVLVQMHDLQP